MHWLVSIITQIIIIVITTIRIKTTIVKVTSMTLKAIIKMIIAS